VVETTIEPIKNIVAQYQVEWWEEEKGMEIVFLLKNNLIQDSEGNEEKDIQFQTQTKQR
jgi:hypothetical protein